MSDEKNKPAMKFSFGALKEIKAELGIDLMSKDGAAATENLEPENFERMAQAAFKHSGNGFTDEEAAAAASCVDLAEVLNALEKSFRANSAVANE